MLRAQALQASNQYRQMQEAIAQQRLAQQAEYQRQTLEQRAPLVGAQTEQASAGARMHDASANLNTQKLLDLVNMASLAERAGQKASRLALPNGNPLLAGEGPTAVGGRQLDMADLVGVLTQIAASNPTQAREMLQPRQVSPNNNVVDIIGRTLQVGQPKDYNLSPGQMRMSGQTDEPIAQAPFKPTAAPVDAVQAQRMLASAGAQFGKLLSLTKDNDVMRQQYAPMIENLSNIVMNASSQLKPQPKKVATKEEYDALPSGTQYVGPDGYTAIKK